MDVILRRVTVIDGTGIAPFRADIGFVADRIAAVGDLRERKAGRVIDASALVAAPGFIDIHSHSDFSLPIAPRSESKIRQGVTTEVVGQCGHSPAPVAQGYRDELIRMSGIFPGRLPWTWWSFGDFLKVCTDGGLGVNVFPLVGHGAIRLAVMGMEARRPEHGEMVAMRGLLLECLEQGALGLSTGLVYAPGAYAEIEELVELSRVVAKSGGLYFSHIRGHGRTLLESIREALAVAEGARLPVQVSHLKASGRENWPKFDLALELLDKATARGLDVGTDMYPYTAARTYITALLPQWVMQGGMGAARERLRSRGTRAEIKREVLETGVQRMEPRWEDMVVAYCPPYPEHVGANIRQLAERAGQDPIEFVLDLADQSDGKVGLIVFWMSEENVRKGLRHRLVSIGTDGRGLSATGSLAEGHPHPRNYGTYPRILGYYVREERLLPLAEAIYKMTGLPADRLGLKGRGKLVEGHHADVVLFDPMTVDDMGDYAQPPRYPRGIEYVFVNGEMVVDRGELTGLLPGRILGWSDVSR